MSLQRRVLAIVSVVVLIVAGAFFGAGLVLVKRSFADLEREQVRDSVNRFADVLRQEQAALGLAIVDHAHWDAAHAWARGANEEFVGNDFAPEFFEDIPIDFAVATDSAGNVIFSGGAVDDDGVATAVPEGLAAGISERSELWHGNDPETVTTALWRDDDVYSVSAAPITDNEETQAVGTFVFGRKIGDERLAAIEELLRTDVGLESLEAAGLEAEIAADLDVSTNPGASATGFVGGAGLVSTVVPRSDDEVLGYGAISVADSDEPIVISVAETRETSQSGQRFVWFLGAGLVGVCALLVVTLLFLLRRVVLERLLGLSGAVREIATTGNRSERVPVRGDDELATLAVDINALLGECEKADVRLEQKAMDLERSNEDLERFAYVAAHDLKEPLRAIAGSAQVLRREHSMGFDADAEAWLDDIVDGADRLDATLDSLLDYSRVDSGAGSIVETGSEEAVERAIANLRASIQESQARVDFSALPDVRADPAQLEQVFQNLLGNAIKFRGSNSPEIAVGAARREADVEFVVSDNGIGIDDSQRERIFGMFRCLHGRDEYPGTGMGLAICKRIIELQGGEIWVEAAPDEGSELHFTLPAATDSTGRRAHV